MAKILIITGRLAEPIIKRVVSEVKSEHTVDVLTMPVSIAAFLTTEYVAKYLRDVAKVKSGDYDYILLPGLTMGSGKVIEEAVGIKALKGTLDAYGLTEILKLRKLDEVLSPDIPADEVMQNSAEKMARDILLKIEASLNDENSISVGRVRIPLNPPPIRVMAEVFEAHLFSLNEVLERARYYVESGADLVAVGFEALNPHPDKVYEFTRKLKENLDVPIAVDSSIPSEIRAAVNAGADMVVNIDLTNIDKVSDIDKDIAIVVVPRDPNTGLIPQDPDLRVKYLVETVNRAENVGFSKVIADAVLDPPLSTFRSLIAYYKFKEVMPNVPMFMGIGNVTELIDADSIGVNAIMTMLAQEVGASIVFTVEKSQKARGSVLELKVASQMAAIARYRESPPKNLGITMLVLKDKRRAGIEINEPYSQVIDASEEERRFRLDPLGLFKIYVDHKNHLINALYIGKKGRILIRGRSARAVRYEIAARGLVSEISHALYLGEELAKAETALILGKEYVQERPLFKQLRYIKVSK